MDKRFWAIVLVIGLVFVGIIVFNKKDESAKTNVAPTNHVIGNDKSDIKLVEYGDFQCPACAGYYPIVEQVVEEYKDRIQFQFRHLPLNQIHQNAFASARAAEAADKQGKFWEMYDTLYQNQEAWSESQNPKSMFEGYAKDLGLNVDQFNKDYSSEEVNDLINADINAFNQTKASKQTPTFFLNGERIDPDRSAESFKKLIDEALAKKS